MSDVTLSFKCDEYLRQWFINESGGEIPVRLRKGSPESHLLEFSLVPKSRCQEEPEKTDDDLVVIIPSFRYKDPEYYNALTPTGRKAFVEILRKRFDLQLWQEFNGVSSLGLRKDELIYTWMETHGIDVSDRNYEAVSQRLKRLERRLRTKIRVRNFRKKSH